MTRGSLSPALSPRLLTPLLLAVLALLLVLTSVGKRLSYDEPYHLEYGRRFLVEGPQVRMRERLPMMALSALPCLATGCEKATLDASESARLLVRAPTMLFALLCGWLLKRWTAAMLGEAAGLLALGLYVFNPTVLAHGKQVTGDMATACFTVGALYAAWLFASERRPVWFLAAALATAGAALSKYTALLLIVLVPALALFGGALRSLATRRRAAGLALAGSVAFVLLVLLQVAAAYGFDGLLSRAAETRWQSDLLKRAAALDVRLPVPVPYAQGFDFAADLQERGAFAPTYVLGQRHPRGVWYAFPVMVLLKTPLAGFGLLALGLAALRARRDALLYWLLPAALILAFFSLGVQIQIGVRYVLPALLLGVPLAGAAALSARPRLVLGLALWYVASSLSYLPHPMSYFNELIGGRVNAWRFLADSNLDWEDRSAEIAAYSARHPELDIAVEPPEPRSGYVLVGANRLLGLIGDDDYRWLRKNHEPIGHVGYSYLLFSVPPGDPR